MFDPKPLPTEEQDADLVAWVNVTIRDLQEAEGVDDVRSA